METRHDPRLRATLTTIAELTSEAYVVGGAVRDWLIGQIDRKDLDLAVEGDGFEIARQIAERCRGIATFVPLDATHGTGRIVLHGEPSLSVDVTSFRAATLDEDLRGRDFTINALALGIQDFLIGRLDRVLDPTGGKADLRARTIRACSTNSFQDDAVRVLRAFRFMASLEFEISEETLKMLAAALDALPSTAPERLRDELIATLAADASFPALKKMDAYGVFDVLFPELRPMKGCGQNDYHHLDVWDHSLETVHQMEDLLAKKTQEFGFLSEQIDAYAQQEPVKNRPRKALLKLAAIFHDAGKPEARFVDSKGRVRFFGHEKISQRIFNEAGKHLKLATREIATIGETIAGHMRPSIFTGKEVSRRAIHRMHSKFQRNVIGLLLLFLADLRASQGPARQPEAYERAWNEVLRALALCFEAEAKALQPLLNGRDLMSQLSIGPGPQLGKLLKQLRELQAIGEITTREEGFKAARKIFSRPELRDVAFLKGGKKQPRIRVSAHPAAESTSPVYSFPKLVPRFSLRRSPRLEATTSWLCI
jgi:poly(A) polymerase